MHPSIKRATRAAAAAAVVAAVAGGTTLAWAGGTVSAARPVTVYEAPENPAAGVSARVHEVVTGNGRTTVTLHVWGFGEASVGRTFGAHAHTGPCGAVGTDAGPHYTHPASAPALEDREIWLDFTVKPGGTAHARATRTWTIVPTETQPLGARSVVIHALPTDAGGVAGARLACIDVPFAG